MAVEPTSSTVFTASGVGLLITVLGPTVGQYTLIVACALGGAMWPLAAVLKTSDKSGGAWFLLRITVAASLLTGPTAWYLESTWGIPAIHAMAGVAFIIGAVGNGWRKVITTLLGAMVSRVGDLGGKK